MAANVLIAYYSAYGHVFRMAQAVEEGAKSVAGTTVRLRRAAEFQEALAGLRAHEHYRKCEEAQKDVPVVTLDDMRWADGVSWGTPTRFGNMCAQLKQFIDSLGGMWMKGELEDKVTSVFVSTATVHGGQESTILSTAVPLLHLGMIFIGSPYGQNPQILTTDGIGGSPYGPGTLAGADGSRQPVESELLTARNLGSRVANTSARLKDMRQPAAG
jgi:NAD(P)H dehydrogenase (quinone)